MFLTFFYSLIIMSNTATSCIKHLLLITYRIFTFSNFHIFTWLLSSTILMLPLQPRRLAPALMSSFAKE
jgi:hypothetical protein